jgi:hypothetical protein
LKAALDEGTKRTEEHAERILDLAERLHAATVDLHRAHGEITALRSEVSELVGAGAERGGPSMTDQVHRLRAEIEQIRQSSSWRLTRPLRAIVRPRRTLMILLKRLER